MQIASFIGQSKPFVDADLPVDRWRFDDPDALFARLRDSLFDHGRERFIISVHLTKRLFAALDLVDARHADRSLMASALGRFFEAPMKGRHVIRTARQMLAVAADGY